MLKISLCNYMQLGNRNLADAKKVLDGYAAMVRKRLADNKQLYLTIDPYLGWRNQASSCHPRWGYRTNVYGNRISWPESYCHTAPKSNIAIAGNSHVHGDENPEDDTWAWKLQTNLGNKIRVHNLGVTAYATDQAIDRLDEFTDEHSIDLALLAITTTEIYRNLNMCRAFIMNDREVPLFKPRYILKKNRLERVSPPEYSVETVDQILNHRTNCDFLKSHDCFYPTKIRQGFEIARRFRLPLPTPWQYLYHEAVKITKALIQKFEKLCHSKNITGAVLFLPTYWGGFPAGSEYDDLAIDIPDALYVIDGREVFTDDRKKMPSESLHHPANHYKACVSQWIADYISQSLVDQKIINA